MLIPPYRSRKKTHWPVTNQSSSDKFHLRLQFDVALKSLKRKLTNYPTILCLVMCSSEYTTGDAISSLAQWESETDHATFFRVINEVN